MFDFSTEIDRSGTYSLKWNVAEGELPAWVADMDFRTAPVIVEAATRAAERGLYGYTIVPEAFGSAVSSWYERRYGWHFAPECVRFATGVMPAVHSLVRTLTNPGDKVVVLTPVYHCFFQAIEENGRTASTVPLVEQEDGAVRIDFDALEAALRDPAVRLMILCNPHNPTGTLWSEEDLRRIGELTSKAGVLVLSDEIHGDLVDPGTRYVPYQKAIDDEARRLSLTCVSPSKTFNIPTLGVSALIVPDERLRARAAAGLHRDQVCNPGALVIEPALAAYNAGESWLEELLVVLEANKRRTVQFIADELPKVKCRYPLATYLLWLDISAYGVSSTVAIDVIRRTTGLILSPGSQFRPASGEWLRFNVATQATRLEDALGRLKRGLEALEQEKGC